MKFRNFILAGILGLGLLENAIADLNNGLMAYYPFDGNVNDESGNGLDGMPFNISLTEDRFGNENQAYNFNGNGSKINLPFTPPNIFSLSLWYKAARTQLENCGIASTFSTSSYNGFYFAYRTSNVQRLWYDNNALIDITPDWEEWVYLTIVSDGNRILVYKNGVVVRETNGKTTHAASLVIGDSRFKGRYFTGLWIGPS